MIVALLFVAMVLNYFDRQMIAVLKPTLAADLSWNEGDYANIITAFQAAYAASYLLLGRFVDRFGAKAGFAVAFAVWSVAQIAHGFVRSPIGFVAARVLLGMGEGGAYPAGLTAVAQWFPKSERAFATGVVNAGVNIGAIVTPIVVPFLVLRFGWRSAFVITGIVGTIWLVGWVLAFPVPRDNGTRTNPDSLPGVAWSRVFRRKETWAYAIAKFLIDPIWWMFLFWLPDFFAKRYGLDLRSFGPPLVFIYILSDLGNLSGGWLSSHLIKRGVQVGVARKVTMLICVFLAVPVAFAMYAHSMWLAACLIGLAAAAHQAFSVNLFTFPSDVFPPSAAGSVIGFGGMAGAIGGMAIAQFTGWILTSFGTYTPMFAMACSAYLLALLAIHLLSPGFREVELI
jgi:ACS family hexuronate transporter-like MFS transporter